MTRVWHRRLVRLNNHFPLILGVLLVAGAGGYFIDRVASLGARLARAML
jgi:hypothetical protein